MEKKMWFFIQRGRHSVIVNEDIILQNLNCHFENLSYKKKINYFFVIHELTNKHGSQRKKFWIEL